MPTTLTRTEIEQRIPHRAPFLYLDEVTSLEPTKIIAKTYVDPSWAIFQGHYPGSPLLPGVMQCEAAFQAGAVLMSQLGSAPAGRVPVVTRLNNTQFRRMVRPGETLTIEVELQEQFAGAVILKGKVSVDGQVSCRLEFVCALAEAVV